MGLFDIFRRRQPDVTADWVKDNSQTCQFSLERASLNNVCLGDSFDRLRWLGPAEGRSQGPPPNVYYYFSRGLQLSECDGEIDHFIIEFFQPPEWRGDARLKPFTGETTYQVNTISLSPTTTPDDLVSQIGEPTDHREQHEDSLSLHYSFNDVTVSFDFISDQQGNLVLHAVLVS